MFRLKSTLQLYKFSSCKCNFSTQTPLQSAGPMASLLKTRSVIRFKGPDTIKFLQGLVTNDVRVLGDPLPAGENSTTPNMPVDVAPTVFTAMLTPQGRFLYDFFLYRGVRLEEKLDRTGSGPGQSSDEMDIYADVDGSFVDEVLAALKRYRLRSNVDIENVGGDFSCWQLFGGKSEVPSSVGWGGTVDPAGVSASQGDNAGWNLKKDPRLACLGHRGIFPSNTIPPFVEADTETDERNYLLWRLEKGVAEGSTEIPKGEAIPLEYNLAGLNAISFSKGCYIGQELIARTHHRGVIRKRLIPLRFLNDSGQEVEEKVGAGSEVINSASKKKVGEVTTALGSCGLGLLRLEEAFKPEGSLTLKGQEDVHVETIKPKWWPSEWFSDP